MFVYITGSGCRKRELVASMVDYCAQMLMPRIAPTISIDIQLVHNLYDKEGVVGDCIPDDFADANHPRDFVMRIDSKEPLREMLETVAHEMVHVKQFAKGELYQSSRNSKHRWQGQWVNKDPDYWDCPWEIEAFGRQPGLFLRWVAKNNYQKKKWAKLS